MKRFAAELVALLIACCPSGALSAQAGLDTLLRVQPGVVIRVDMHDGTLRVGTGAPNQVRVQVPGESSSGVLVLVRGDTIAIMSPPSRRRENVLHFDITVPQGARLLAAGADAEIKVVGALGNVTVSAQHGRVEMKGIRGVAQATLFRGPISMNRITGRVEATTLRGDIELTDIQGNAVARNTDGHIHLADIDGDSVTAQSVDGEVAYRGALRRTGVYSLSTHKEGVRLKYAPGSSATIHGVTVQGAFTRPQQWTLSTSRDSAARNMVIGTGATTVRLSTFRGLIDVAVSR